MTALNWLLTDDFVLVASDTLVVNHDDKEPICFSQKVHPIGHAGTLIAGTGAVNCIAHVAYAVTAHGVVRHAPDIADVVPQLANQMYGQLPQDMSSTIYTFGWNEDRERMEGMAFRSTNGFVPEPLEPGLGIKPQIEVSWDDVGAPPYEEFFVNTAVNQRKMVEASDADDVKIGGEIILYHLDQRGFGIKKIHRFDDYALMFNSAAARLEAEQRDASLKPT